MELGPVCETAWKSQTDLNPERKMKRIPFFFILRLKLWIAIKFTIVNIFISSYT